MDGTPEDDAGAQAGNDGGGASSAYRVPLVARASTASTFASSVAINSRATLKSPFFAAAPRVAKPAAPPGSKVEPSGRAAHYTGRMTIYVLVVALVSATGGMLFG